MSTTEAHRQAGAAIRLPRSLAAGSEQMTVALPVEYELRVVGCFDGELLGR